MLIDWFTVSAQVLNFLILVWLMKRFLYQPILNAIDAREKLIAKELADADAKQNDALQEREAFKKKNDEFDQQYATLLRQVKEEANIERKRLFNEAKEAADAFSKKRYEALITEMKNLNQSISKHANQEIFSIVRKTLSDLATVSLEERVVEVFVRRLQEMDTHSKATMLKALKTMNSPAMIRSAFELPVNQRKAIKNALSETFSVDITVKYETSPDLISGIELIANGQRLAWSVDDYLSTLEKNVIALLNVNAHSEKQPEAKAKKQ